MSLFTGVSLKTSKNEALAVKLRSNRQPDFDNKSVT